MIDRSKKKKAEEKVEEKKVEDKKMEEKKGPPPRTQRENKSFYITSY